MFIPIRRLQAKDLDEIRSLILQENTKLEIDEMYPTNTYVWDDGEIKGFFYFKFEHNCPSLRHFLIKKEYRNIKNARLLLNEYIKIVKDFKYSIISVNKPYLQKLVEYKFRKKPYGNTDKVVSYFVEI